MLQRYARLGTTTCSSALGCDSALLVELSSRPNPRLQKPTPFWPRSPTVRKRARLRQEICRVCWQGVVVELPISHRNLDRRWRVCRLRNPRKTYIQTCKCAPRSTRWASRGCSIRSWDVARARLNSNLAKTPPRARRCAARAAARAACTAREAGRFAGHAIAITPAAASAGGTRRAV